MKAERFHAAIQMNPTPAMLLHTVEEFPASRAHHSERSQKVTLVREI